MSIESNKAVVLRSFEEVFNSKNLAAIDELMASDHVDHALSRGLPDGREGSRQAIAMTLTAFPDHVTFSAIDIRIAEGRWAEEWGVEDRLAMLQQIGLAPVMT